MRRLFLSIMAISLMACSPAQPPLPDATKVSLTDEIGTFEGDVTGMAFWHHPFTSYESGVVVANGAAGLIFISIEGNASEQMPGEFMAGVDVVYLDGDEALVFAVDQSQKALVGFRKSVSSLTLQQALSFPLDDAKDIHRFCMIGPTQAIFIFQNGSAVNRSFGENRTSTPVVSKKPLEDCAADMRSGRIFFATKDGAMLELQANGKLSQISGARKQPVIGLSIVAEKDSLSLVSFLGGDENVGVIYNTDMPVEIETFSLGYGGADETISASAFAATGGNLGSVYRNGAFTFVNKATGMLFFAPWIGLAGGDEDGQERTLSPRPDTPAKEQPITPQIELQDFTDLVGRDQ